jgi:hypothetical protein
MGVCLESFMSCPGALSISALRLTPEQFTV